MKKVTVGQLLSEYHPKKKQDQEADTSGVIVAAILNERRRCLMDTVNPSEVTMPDHIQPIFASDLVNGRAAILRAAMFVVSAAVRLASQGKATLMIHHMGALEGTKLLGGVVMRVESFAFGGEQQRKQQQISPIKTTTLPVDLSSSSSSSSSSFPIHQAEEMIKILQPILDSILSSATNIQFLLKEMAREELETDVEIGRIGPKAKDILRFRFPNDEQPIRIFEARIPTKTTATGNLQETAVAPFRFLFWPEDIVPPSIEGKFIQQQLEIFPLGPRFPDQFVLRLKCMAPFSTFQGNLLSSASASCPFDSLADINNKIYNCALSDYYAQQKDRQQKKKKGQEEEEEEEGANKKLMVGIPEVASPLGDDDSDESSTSSSQSEREMSATEVKVLHDNNNGNNHKSLADEVVAAAKRLESRKSLGKLVTLNTESIPASTATRSSSKEKKAGKMTKSPTRKKGETWINPNDFDHKKLHLARSFIDYEEARFEMELIRCARCVIASMQHPPKESPSTPKKDAEESPSEPKTTTLPLSPALTGKGKCVLLVTGPSASGKTTFALRLGLTLQAMRFPTCTISTDDYYMDIRDPRYPLLPNGKPNHETVEALRIDQFLTDIQKFYNGEEVEVPIFDMKNSRPLEKGRMLQPISQGVLIVEGIFSFLMEKYMAKLNIPTFRVFISPTTTTMALDDLKMLSSEDLRTFRRIARDYLHRGRDATASIARLDNVIAGSVSNVLPLIESAHYFFNSCFAHEFSLLKRHCVPLLRQVVPKTMKEYQNAQMFLELLEAAVPIHDRLIPLDSLAREFVGGSIFDKVNKQALRRPSLARIPIFEDILRKRIGGRAGRPPPNQIQPTTDQKSAPTNKEEDEEAPIITLADILLGENTTDETEEKEDLVGVIVEGDFLPMNWPVTNPEEAKKSLLMQQSTNIDATDTATTTSPPIINPANVKLISRKDWLGHQVYRATCSFVLHVAAKLAVPEKTVAILHGFGVEGTPKSNGYYCRTVERFSLEGGKGGTEIGYTDEEIQKIKQQMMQLVAEKRPIEVVSVMTDEALKHFQSHGQKFSEQLLLARCYEGSKLIVATKCEGLLSMYIQPLASHCGYCTPFDLVSMKDQGGMALCFGSPGEGNHDSLSVPTLHHSMRHTLGDQRVETLSTHEIHCVGDLNNKLATGEATHIAELCSSMSSIRFQNIVHHTVKNEISVILVAGTSGGGKTYFVRSLQFHLQVDGIASTVLPMDCYYKDMRDPTYPIGENGQKDCESPNALRFDALNKHIEQLLQGEAIEVPVFDLGRGMLTNDTQPLAFTKPHRKATGKRVLIVEGLFALCDQLAPKMPNQCKYKLLLMPFSVVNLDELRFVSNSLLRALRRILRDFVDRERDATTTLRWWTSVSEGEVKHTVPFLSVADQVINTADVHEISTLRPKIETLLKNVKPKDVEEYGKARQLMKLLNWYNDFPESAEIRIKE